MRGTEITHEQLECAEAFILDQSSEKQAPEGLVTISFDNFVRMVAWYGALRYQAGRDGINSLKNPGRTYTVKR